MAAAKEAALTGAPASKEETSATEDGASEEEASSASDWVEVANVDGAAVVSALAGASELTKEEAATEEAPEAAAEEAADEEAATDEAAEDEAAEEEAEDDAEEDSEEEDSKTEEEEAEFPETSWPCSLQVDSKASLAVWASPLGHLSSKHCSTFSPMEVQMHSKSAKLLHWEFFSTSATQANKQAGGVAIT